MALCLKPLNTNLYPEGPIAIPEGRDVLTIGRDPGNEIPINDQPISSRHALLRRSGSDGLEIEDCDSSNGTFVNGARIERQVLSDGDVVKFATAAFRVEPLNGANSAPVVSLGRTQAVPLPITPPASREDENTKQQFQAGLNALQRQLDEVRGKLGDLEGERESLNKQVLILNQEIETKNEALSRAEKEIAETQTREATLGERLSESRNAVIEKEGAIASLQYELQQRDSTIAKLETELAGRNEAFDQLDEEHGKTLSEMNAQAASLAKAKEASAKATAQKETVLERLASLTSRLEEDWKIWIPKDLENDLPTEDGTGGASFAKAERVAENIRSELDLIEPIWGEFGDGVQNELRKRCEELRSEISDLETSRIETRKLEDEAKTDLAEIRKLIDEEIRRAQGLNRRGVKAEIPERFQSMVIANDREQEIFSSLVERLEEIEGLIHAYRKSKKFKDVVVELSGFHTHFSAILEENGVAPFEVENGLLLTPRHRKEVQIMTKKGWGTKEYGEHPFQRGEVKKLVRPGYRFGEGDEAVILRKAEVLIREIDD